MGVLGGTLDAVLGALASPSNAGPGPITVDDLVPLVQSVVWLGKTVDDVFNQAADQAAVATLLATGIGNDIDNLAQQYKFAFEHTYKTVIPHSLDWLEGNIVRNYITPLRSRVGKVEKRVTALETWRADIHGWRVNVVDPTLNDYRAFKRLWNSWPLDTVTTVRMWIQHPAQFAQFAVPAIAHALVAYFGDSANELLTDTFVGILVDESPSRYRHVLDAFETMLDQEWP